MEEFTKQFQDNIDREVFRRTFKEELNPLVTARPYRDVVSFVNMFFKTGVAPLSVIQIQIRFFLQPGNGPSCIYANLQPGTGINNISMASRVRHMWKITIQHYLGSQQGT